MRSFDPRAVGGRECRAWEAYYRRQWAAFLVASVGMVRAAFAMSWPRTLVAAWLVLRANQVWAPADHDPGAARALMTRFYRILRRAHGAAFDPREAARLEVEWWRAHREGDHDGLVAALTALYAFIYGAADAAVRPAAELRAEAMDVSDRWVADGCEAHAPALAQERALLVRSYAALLAAAHRP
ncbi:MAG: hypothetical protein ACXVFL_12015 [Solirubrobacteraceae bacterium]